MKSEDTVNENILSLFLCVRCTKFMKRMLSLEETSVDQSLLFVSEISVQLLTNMVLEQYTERCLENLIFRF